MDEQNKICHEVLTNFLQRKNRKNTLIFKRNHTGQLCEAFYSN